MPFLRVRQGGCLDSTHLHNRKQKRRISHILEPGNPNQIAFFSLLSSGPFVDCSQFLRRKLDWFLTLYNWCCNTCRNFSQWSIYLRWDVESILNSSDSNLSLFILHLKQASVILVRESFIILSVIYNVLVSCRYFSTQNVSKTMKNNRLVVCRDGNQWHEEVFMKKHKETYLHNRKQQRNEACNKGRFRPCL